MALFPAVANEGSNEDQAVDEIGSLGRGKDGGASSHGVAHHHGGAIEFLNEGDDVTCRLDVSVGSERRVAIAVTTQVRACDPVARVTKRRRRETVRTSQIAHSGHQNDERTIAADVIANPAFRTIEE